MPTRSKPRPGMDLRRYRTRVLRLIETGKTPQQAADRLGLNLWQVELILIAWGPDDPQAGR